jgi:hypothetical protein
LPPGIDPEAAAAVLGTTPSPAAADGATPPANAAAEEDGEENIYEVMKQHMRRKQEEADAAWAAKKAQQGGYGRPGPGGGPPGRPGAGGAGQPAVQRSTFVEKVANLADLDAVWTAARTYLAQNARMLESVLGGCTRVHALSTPPAAPTPEVTLHIPKTQQNFTNDKARAKLEEALRAVTGLPLKLVVDFITPPPSAHAPGGAPGGAAPNAPLQAAQRIPPELLDAVNKHPLVQELVKRLDATVTHIEPLDVSE